MNIEHSTLNIRRAVIVLTLLAGFTCRAADTKPVDWRKLMTVAEVKRDASGQLLPLQSYDETIRRGMSFILDDHLKWFKATDTLADENGTTQMPWVYYSNLQHNGVPFKPPTTSHTTCSRTTGLWWVFNTSSGGTVATPAWCCTCLILSIWSTRASNELHRGQHV